MRHLRIVFGIVVVVGGLLAGPAVPLHGAAAAASQQPPARPAPQDEFVPIDQLPPQEELPAAPMVVAAYSFVWVAFVAYVFTLLKRLRKVETDLTVLERGRR
jgi:hypothetical protein